MKLNNPEALGELVLSNNLKDLHRELSTLDIDQLELIKISLSMQGDLKRAEAERDFYRKSIKASIPVLFSFAFTMGLVAFFCDMHLKPFLAYSRWNRIALWALSGCGVVNIFGAGVFWWGSKSKKTEQNVERIIRAILRERTTKQTSKKK